MDGARDNRNLIAENENKKNESKENESKEKTKSNLHYIGLKFLFMRRPIDKNY